jgi:N-acetylmuramoyl-L-alanine amidase
LDLARSLPDRRFLLRLAGAVAALSAVPPAFAAPAKRVRPLPLVMLDPGHGGVDPGCIGVRGSFEKDITLATARAVARGLEASGRYRVRLTRTDDEFVELHDRVALARAAGADLMLSIHADALPDGRMRGASVFTLSDKASDRAAAAVAARENRADRIAGIDLSRHAPEVSNILFELARRETSNESIRLARDLVTSLGRKVPLLNHSHRSAGFVVLKAPDVPSALVEIGCLSNRQEEAQLKTAPYQRKIAAALVQSVGEFFDQIA